MGTNTTVLITGANRGIGKGLLEYYLAKPNHTVIAANRDPAHATSKALYELHKGPGSSVTVVKVESTNATDPARAVAELQSIYGVTHLDLVIANAGISEVWPKVSELNVWDLQRHLDINVYGVVWLFQAVLPLLNKATTPKWVSMSSSAGSLELMATRPIPSGAYGTSKAALNYLTLKIHLENPRLCAFPIDPGWVQTDLGNYGAVALGFEQAEIPTEESIGGMVEVIDAATRESAGGNFLRYTGEKVPW